MKRRGFTIVELMVSMAIISLLMIILVAMTSQVSATWRFTASKVEQFREARTAFETVTRRLSEATLNTYWDYQDVNRDGVPEKYTRQSELRFLCGPMEKLAADGEVRPTHGVFFQAPLGVVDRSVAAGGGDYRGLDSLLSTWGCFVEFGDDRESRPSFLTEAVAPLRYRYRLHEFIAPADKLTIYNPAAQNLEWRGWFADGLGQSNRPVRVMAENIIAMVLLPKLSKTEEDERRKAGKAMLSEDFTYDSTRSNSQDPEINPKNQLPPLVQVTLVAIDEPSALRLADRYGSDAPNLIPSDLFQDARMLEDDPSSAEPKDGDLAALEQKLIGEKITYRLFTANVIIRAAKWSRAQID